MKKKFQKTNWEESEWKVHNKVHEKKTKVHTKQFESELKVHLEKHGGGVAVAECR